MRRRKRKEGVYAPSRSGSAYVWRVVYERPRRARCPMGLRKARVISFVVGVEAREARVEVGDPEDAALGVAVLRVAGAAQTGEVALADALAVAGGR